MKIIVITLLSVISISVFGQRLTFSYVEKRDGKFGLLDTTEKVLLPFEYDDITTYYYVLQSHVLNKTGMLGLADEFGKVLLDCKYDRIDMLNYVDGDAVTFDLNGKMGFCSVRSGKSTNCEYDEIKVVSHNGKPFVLVKKNGLYGLANYDGELLLEPEYSEILINENSNSLFHNDRAVIVKNERYPGKDLSGIPDYEIKNYYNLGVYNIDQGYWLFPMGENQVLLFDDLILIGLNDLYDVYDYNSKPQFRFSRIEQKYLTVRENPYISYIFDEKYFEYDNKVLGPFNSFDFSTAGDGFITMEENGKWGLISLLSAKVLIPCIYERPLYPNKSVFSFNDNITIVNGYKDNFEFTLDTLGRILYTASSGKQISDNGKYGYAYYNSDMNFEIPTVNCIYDNLIPFMPDFWDYDLLQVWKDGKTGLVNTRGEIIVPIEQKEFIRIPDNRERAVISYTNGTSSFVHFLDSNKSIGPDIISYEYLETGNDYYLILTRDNQKKYNIWTSGLSKINKEPCDQVYMSEMDNYEGRVYAFPKKNNKFGIINPDGVMISECIYDNVSLVEFDNYYGFIFFYTRNNGKVGLVDNKGKRLIDNLYDNIQMVDNDRDENMVFKVSVNGKWGLVDTSGRIFLKTEFDDFESLYSWSPVSRNKLWGFVNDSLNLIIDCKYEEAEDLTDEFARVKYKGAYGVINRKDKFVLQPVYKDISWCSHGIYFVMENNLWGIKDTSEKWITNPAYNQLGKKWPGNDYYSVAKNGKWGIVNYITAEEIGKFEYQGISFNWENPCARVIKNNKYGYIDSKGNDVIPCEYDFLSESVKEGKILAVKNKKYGFISPENKEIITFKFNEANEFTGGFSSASQNGKWAVIDSLGNNLGPYEYDKITYIDNKYAIAVKGKKYGVVKHNGEVVYPFDYSLITGSPTTFNYTKSKNETGYFDKP